MVFSAGLKSRDITRTAEKNEDGTNTKLRSSSHDQLVDTKSLFLLDLLPTSVLRNLITERTKNIHH